MNSLAVWYKDCYWSDHATADFGRKTYTLEMINKYPLFLKLQNYRQYVHISVYQNPFHNAVQAIVLRLDSSLISAGLYTIFRLEKDSVYGKWLYKVPKSI